MWTIINTLSLSHTQTQHQFIVNVNISTPNIDVAERYARLVPDGSVCTVAGWMAPSLAVPNPQLLAAEVTVLGRDACAQHYTAGDVLESMMCARSVAPAANRPALCESNRGAGLFRRGFLVGVASGGFPCATPNSNEPGVYTQVRGGVDNILNYIPRHQPDFHLIPFVLNSSFICPYRFACTTIGSSSNSIARAFRQQDLHRIQAKSTMTTPHSCVDS